MKVRVLTVALQYDLVQQDQKKQLYNLVCVCLYTLESEMHQCAKVSNRCLLNLDSYLTESKFLCILLILDEYVKSAHLAEKWTSRSKMVCEGHGEFYSRSREKK